MNADYGKFVINSKDRRGKDHSYKLDSSKIRKELKWSDKIDLEIGLKRTLQWVNDHINTLSILPREYKHKK